MGVAVPAYKWAKTIKELDGNKCVFCGSTEKLEAHHIQQKAAAPEMATDLENGITLCHKCHYTAHGANYTTDGHITAVGYKEYSTNPKVMQDFIRDYADCTIVIRVPKGDREKIRAFAESCGENTNHFINRLISEAMDQGNEKGRA